MAMRSLPARSVAALAAGVAALVVAIGVIADAVDERSDLREHAAVVTRGDPERGEAMFIKYGCGGCHGLKHVRKATGAVGPSLDGIAVRAMLAGRLDNNPDNLQTWIRDPQRASPGTAMPDLNVGERDARDISAFLYTRAE
jgi:cytochrome c